MPEEQWDAEHETSCGPENNDVPETEFESGETRSVALSIDGYTFETIVGFDEEIERLRSMGVIDSVDEDFLAFVEQMKKQHGLYDVPTGGAIIFKSAVRDDADRLMIATANELGRPIIRMRVIDGPLGSRALCIMSTPGLGASGFKDWGTLVLEGVDTWGGVDNPLAAAAAFPGANMQDAASSALKAFAVIQSSVMNPKVTVLASVSESLDPAMPITALLQPAKVFPIEPPSESERDAIWDYLMDKHVSISILDKFELVKLSRGMPRCDIFSAAKEAVVEAFRQSIEQRSYVPVSRSNMLEKIAAYQPLESAEYREIENSVVEDFMHEIDRMERGEE